MIGRVLSQYRIASAIGAGGMGEYGQLGETKAAEKALGGLLTLRPDFPRVVRGMAANWWNPEYCERLLDGLRKAGLDVPAQPP